MHHFWRVIQLLLLYWLLPGRYRGMFLLGVSYFFYIKESCWAGLLLLCTTIVTFLAGRAIGRGRRKKVWLTAAVAVCLGLLIGLKYTVPPVGISFYTFQTLSYVIDVYRGTTPAEEKFGCYALFVSFFPQLVAGPIERAESLLGQLKEEHARCRQDLVNGLWLILRGFYKKVVVADVLAVYVDRVYSAPQEAGGLGVILLNDAPFLAGHSTECFLFLSAAAVGYAGLSMLLYGSLWPFVVFPVILPLYLHMLMAWCIKKQKCILKEGFVSAMEAFVVALRAGYSAESAVERCTIFGGSFNHYI